MNSHKKTAIYVSRKIYATRTLVFQEKFCRNLCKMSGLEDITVFKENKKNTSELQKLFDNIAHYDYIVIYSVAALGQDLQDVKNVLQNLLNTNCRLICVAGQVYPRQMIGSPSDLLIFNITVGLVLHLNDTWRKMLNPSSGEKLIDMENFNWIYDSQF